MSVERRLRQHAEALTREVAAIDTTVLLAAIQAAGTPPPFSGRAGFTDPAEELRYHRERAENGDPDCAVRLAELYGLLGRPDEAARWWRHAAGLGDPDAIDYVREFLSAVGIPIPSEAHV
ncbi:hypothetical protein [Actinocrispum sp. NPDC049592]|uniref:hypothetical protein n=1 Tax=Actinocrispum sp. NPDC049592 TaxID=3154835 RepID=UPI00341E279C